MLILGIVLAVIAAILVIAAVVFWLSRMMSQKEVADLNRYLQGEDCEWERLGSSTAGTIEDGVYFVNHAPAPQGIEMRVYEYAEPEGRFGRRRRGRLPFHHRHSKPERG